MGWYTDWFIAEKTDAEKIASIVITEEHGFDDWPHFSVKNVGIVELGQLWSIIINPETCETLSPTGELLYGGAEEGLFVFEVNSDFLKILASVQDEDISNFAEQWSETEELKFFTPNDCIEIITELVGFARQSIKENKPVLELAVF